MQSSVKGVFNFSSEEYRSVFELSGVAFRLAPPNGGLLKVAPKAFPPIRPSARPIVRPSNSNMMTNATLEVTASSSGENRKICRIVSALHLPALVGLEIQSGAMNESRQLFIKSLGWRITLVLGRRSMRCFFFIPAAICYCAVDDRMDISIIIIK